MDKVIIHSSGTSLVGPDAMEIMRLATIISGVKLEAKGMKLTRGISCTKLAKELTGLKTHDRTKLIERLEIMLENQKAKVLYVNEETTA